MAGRWSTGPGRPPAWGHKSAGACRGLDTWVLSEALAAGAYWVSNDHAAIEADPNTTLFDDPKAGAAFKKVFGWELPRARRRRSRRTTCS